MNIRTSLDRTSDFLVAFQVFAALLNAILLPLDVLRGEWSLVAFNGIAASVCAASAFGSLFWRRRAHQHDEIHAEIMKQARDQTAIGRELAARVARGEGSIVSQTPDGSVM